MENSKVTFLPETFGIKNPLFLLIVNERYWPMSRKEPIVLGLCVCVFLNLKYENWWLQRAFVPIQVSCRRNFIKLFTGHSPFPSRWVLKIQTTLKEIYKSKKIYLKRIKKNMLYWDDVQNYLVKINVLPGTDCFFEASCNLKRKKKKKKWWKDFLAFISHATCSDISAHKPLFSKNDSHPTSSLWNHMICTY